MHNPVGKFSTPRFVATVLLFMLLLTAAMIRLDQYNLEEATRSPAQLQRSFERSERYASGGMRTLVSPECTEPPITSNTAFPAELPMYNWAGEDADWVEHRRVYTGPVVKYFQHRSPFPGDVELRLDTAVQTPEFFSISLVIADARASKQEGYLFRYRCEPGPGGSPRSRLELMRAGETLAMQDFFEPPQQISLRRAGNHIIGSVNNRAILKLHDLEPLNGRDIAFITQGVQVPIELVRVTSPNVRDDYFSEAPTDWRTTGSAIAGIRNRSQEDPRWSFFSLENDRAAGNNAVLWNKRKFPGDVSMEIFLGTRMAGERGLPYTYARDVNVSLCADGSDLTKGYTFLWGGYGNRYSAILRNGVEVARIEKKIPTDMNFHRHWFHYRVERRGNRLSFSVDRFFKTESNARPELVYEDPNPLPCDRLALWIYDNAIAISRIRIAGESRPGENPGAPIPPMKFLIEEPAERLKE